MTDVQTHDPFRPRSVAATTADDQPTEDEQVQWDVHASADAVTLDPDAADGVGQVTIPLSQFEFTADAERPDEAPKVGDRVVVLLYEGTDNVSATYEGAIAAIEDGTVVVQLDDEPLDDGVASTTLTGSGAVPPQDGEDGAGGGEGAGEPQTATQPAYGADDVPATAAEVVTWIGEAVDELDARERATAAWTVEQADHQPPRKTVQAAVAGHVEGVTAPD